MTFGIDISTHNATLDIAAAKKAGAEFVIVKAIAAYRRELTVADDYHNNTDRTINAGMEKVKGHYAVPNSENTPAVTAQFQFDIRYRPTESDVYMLDNEPLDTYKVFWRDDNAAAYFEKLHELGIRYDQMWLYCPAALTRAARYWPKIIELRRKGLKIVWVSYGDNDPYREDGEEPFTGDTGLDNPEVHQFTSTWRVPGYAGNVDGNYSPLSISELFGGGRVSLEDQMRQFIGANQKPADAATWDQMCGSLMYRFNSWRGWTRTPQRDISSAYRASQGSALNADFMRAPVGAWHWFDIAGPSNGHVMQDARGGGLVCLSSGYALSESLGKAIGFQSVPGYVAAKGARYLGWSRDYAGGTISTAGLAGGGTTPIGDIVALKDAVDLYYNKDRGYIAVGPGFVYEVGDSDGLTGNQKLSALGAVGIEPKTVDTGVWDALNIIFLGNQAAVDNAKYTASLVNVPVAIDTAALVADIVTGVLAGIPAGGGGGYTPEQVADVVVSKLAAKLAG